MPYPKELVDPMRKELTDLGVEELLDAGEVDAAMDEAQEGTTLLIINSVCGCAAQNARPAVRSSMEAEIQPDRYVTVFAGQHMEATERAREYLRGIPPSSPFMALLKDGDPVFILERRHIEGRSARAIGKDLVEAYEKYCTADAEVGDEPERPELDEGSGNGQTSETFRSIM
jgi:putative YphP/YqiW family bacilliredoxin